MANEVDPRLGQIPEALQKDPIVRRYFEDLERFWHDMWVKVGAGSDPISDSEEFSIEDTSTNAETLEEFEVDLSLLIPPQVIGKEVISTSSDFTTTGEQIIICTNTAAITITLNANPGDGEQVHIKRQNTGRVDVAGEIDGDTIKSITLRYDSPHLIFTVDAGEWSVI